MHFLSFKFLLVTQSAGKETFQGLLMKNSSVRSTSCEEALDFAVAADAIHGDCANTLSQRIFCRGSCPASGGVNLGSFTSYDSGQMFKNLLRATTGTLNLLSFTRYLP